MALHCFVALPVFSIASFPDSWLLGPNWDAIVKDGTSWHFNFMPNDQI